MSIACGRLPQASQVKFQRKRLFSPSLTFRLDCLFPTTYIHASWPWPPDRFTARWTKPPPRTPRPPPSPPHNDSATTTTPSPPPPCAPRRHPPPPPPTPPT